MKVAREESGTIFLYTLDDPHRDLWGGWEGFESMRIPDDSFPEVTYDMGPVPVTLVVNQDSGDYYVAREGNGYLKLHTTPPTRNSVTPRWSSPNKVDLNYYWYRIEDGPKDEPVVALFDDLTWEDEPVRVSIELL